jgi:N-acetylglutamate synthase-like GNAT family acetyltransferase
MYGKPGRTMAGRRIGDGGDRARRASRHDLPALRRLLGVAGERSERFDRRLLRALVADVYVVDGPEGLRGAVSLGFVRSFATGGWRAELDGLWVAPGAETLIEPLVAFAEARAATHQCHELLVIAAASAALSAVLARRGYAESAAWRTAVIPAPVVASPRRRRRVRSS